MKKAPATLGFAILGLLRQQPLSGYDLRKVFAETALGDYSSSPGAIYPALRRLEEQGLVEGEVEALQTLRPKKVYGLTRAGEATLLEWLAAPIEPEDVAHRLHEVMLRFAFHSLLDDPAETARFLEALERECRRHVRALEKQRELFPEKTPIQSRLALEAGIEQYRATARWARRSLAHFAT